MLFIPSIIPTLTFRGSAKSFQVLICECRGLETILRGAWRPCTPFLVQESDGEVIMKMLRRASVDIDVDRINMAGMTALHQVVNFKLYKL